MVTKVLYVSDNKITGYDQDDFKIVSNTYKEIEKMTILVPKKIKRKKIGNYTRFYIKRSKVKYAAIVIEDISKLTVAGAKLLSKIAKPYAILYNGSIEDVSTEIRVFVKKFCPQLADLSNLELLFSDIKKCFSFRQYGDRIGVENYRLNKNFTGKVSFDGNSYLNLEGDFGSEFNQLAYYVYNKDILNDQVIEFWPEYIKEDTVSIFYKVSYILRGSVDKIEKTVIFDENDLKDKIVLETPKDCYISISVFAKGEGLLKLGIIHHRISRKHYGNMVLGADRIVDDTTRQEILFYFEPGDLKPPLNVYFSGYRTAEGFEGYNMIKDLGSPFVLITDPRLEGGAFYFGTKQLENKVVEKINEKLDYLGFNKNEVVTAGLSMGTCGALYYGAKLEAHAILVGLPLANIGNIAINQKLIAPGVFNTSLDIVKFHIGELSIESAKKLNERFWQVFDNADLNHTKIICSYMRDDDYDRTAYYDIINSLKNKDTIVLSRGLEGRHSDATANIIAWFYEQYKDIMVKDFNRDEYKD